MKELHRFRQFLTESKLYKDDVWYIEASEDSADIEQAGPVYKEAVINFIKAKHPDISDEDLEASIEVMNVTWYNEARSNAKGSEPEEMEVSAEDFADGAMEHYEDVIVWDNNNLAEGVIKEELKAPSGWTEIKDLSDMHRSEEDDEIAVKAWDAPMEGWDEKNKDIIVVRKEDDKFYLDGYIPFGSFDEQGPFDTYEEALKLAVEEMEAFKEDWDE